MNDGALTFAYNLGGVVTEYIRSDTVLSAGEHELRMHFQYDGGGLGKGGTVSLYDGDATIDTGHVSRALPFFFSPDETVDIGSDLASSVSANHLMQIAMTRQ